LTLVLKGDILSLAPPPEVVGLTPVSSPPPFFTNLSGLTMKKPLLIESGPALETTGLIHRVKEPDKKVSRRTVVMIHGRLGNEDVMWVFARTLPPDWLVLSIRAPIQEKDGFSWHLMDNDWPHLEAFDDAVTVVSRFIRTLPQQYNADPNQIYLMGFSQGAAVAFATAIKHQGIIKGIAGLVGFLPMMEDNSFEHLPLIDLPVFMAVGKQDPTIPVQLARNSGKTVIAAGANLEYHELDTGHKLNSDGMQKLAAWWNSHT
jgi:phospholipase/carboxylesterase